jgi:hypothetical protein
MTDAVGTCTRASIADCSRMPARAGLIGQCGSHQGKRRAGEPRRVGRPDTDAAPLGVPTRLLQPGHVEQAVAKRKGDHPSPRGPGESIPILEQTAGSPRSEDVLVQLHPGPPAAQIWDHRGVSDKTIESCTQPMGSDCGDRDRHDALSAAISLDLLSCDDASVLQSGPAPRSSA